MYIGYWTLKINIINIIINGHCFTMSKQSLYQSLILLFYIFNEETVF